VQKSCGLNTGIIYTVYVMQVKYVPYLWGDPADPSFLTDLPTSRPPKISTSLTSQIFSNA
jgi:hypothetical protein